MKLFLLAAILFFLPVFVHAQCSGVCPTGSITALPTGAAGATITIPAGTTYCVSGPLSSAAGYTINGTLVVEYGVVTLGQVTLSNTGVVDVETGGQLAVTGTFVGSTSAASSISNVNVCDDGFINVNGAVTQGEANITLTNESVMLAQGDWVSSYAGAYLDIGAGALLEICGAAAIDKNAWLTETSGSVSYLFLDGSGSFDGWISSLHGASLIDWTEESAEANASYPAAHSCIECGNLALAPPGAVAGTCGATANNYLYTTLSVALVDFYETVQGGSLLIDADLAQTTGVGQVILESSSDGRNFYPDDYTAVQSSPNNDIHYAFTLPLNAESWYYRLKIVQGADSSFSWILPPQGPPASLLAGSVFPNPVQSLLYIRLPTGSGYSSASVYDNTGRLVLREPVQASSGLMQMNLPKGLPQGIYMVTLSGAGTSPWVTKVFVTGQ